MFRARDTKLDRDVAIKILPEAFAHDADRLARFAREAKTLASLNHPHIAGIYGFEESNGVSALVMELVEGEDLSQRIARGAIPLDEALPIAKQIAEALEAAHEQGIIHRDLKPANIKVRPDGTVKVLDFGLAKAMEPAADSAPSISMSPTLTTPAMTHAGMILGTAAYMSPEQAAGKSVDKRSDLWALGVVVLEMLTGQPVFTGETVSHVLASILKDEPNWTTLPPNTPAPIHRLLRRCLEKDRRRPLARRGHGSAGNRRRVRRSNGGGVVRRRFSFRVAAAAVAWRRAASPSGDSRRRDHRGGDVQFPADAGATRRDSIHHHSRCGPAIHESRPPARGDLIGRYSGRVCRQRSLVRARDARRRSACRPWDRRAGWRDESGFLARWSVYRVLCAWRLNHQAN